MLPEHRREWILALHNRSGHSFGETLSERDKQALIAFVATL